LLALEQHENQIINITSMIMMIALKMKRK
jgi:hypothetical protein